MHSSLGRSRSQLGWAALLSLLLLPLARPALAQDGPGDEGDAPAAGSNPGEPEGEPEPAAEPAAEPTAEPTPAAEPAPAAESAPAEPAPAAPVGRVEQAKAHYAAGSRLYAAGRYQEAIAELKTAYDLSGETILLYNIAKSYEKLGDFDNAMRNYQDYIDLTPTIAAADRAEVERTIQDLLRKKQELLPELIIRSNPRGADIFLDGREKMRGQTPDKFRIEPGPHQLILEKKGYEPVTKEFVMPAGKPLIFEFELQPLEEYGSVQIVANVTGARVFIDGKNVGITPYSEMPSLKIGFHQVILEKERYLRWEKRVEVTKGRTTLVTAELRRFEKASGAPAAIGWTSLVVGGLAIGGARVANYFADQEFNDTSDFDTYHKLEVGGYIGGGVLLTLATTLIVYDLVRDVPSEDEVAAVGSPGPTVQPLFAFDPRQGDALLGAVISF